MSVMVRRRPLFAWTPRRRGVRLYTVSSGDVVRVVVKRDDALLSPDGPTTGAGAIPGPGGTPGPLVSIPDGVTPGTPGPVGGTTPGPVRRGEYPSGMPNFGSAGDDLRGSGKGPVDDEEGGSGTLIVEIDGEVVGTDAGGARGGDVVSGRGNWDSPFGVGFEKRCGTGVWKRSGGCENGVDEFEFAGPGSPGPGVQPCRGEELRRRWCDATVRGRRVLQSVGHVPSPSPSLAHRNCARLGVGE
ncbi:hypothetical protein JVT61DRAFT_8301 [Boletus reticuloceps]|uniref:Uncharacterized protein n=1 Tax=Boletus reticuloceps TaxID=495285 RepID=A0A8I3AF85_9AGAM|nr:hypothetical protein JVT61DRAFT_8301 [Boletus reticuloceps]